MGSSHGHKGLFVTMTIMVSIRKAKATLIGNNNSNNNAQRLCSSQKDLKFPLGNITCNAPPPPLSLGFVLFFCDPTGPYIFHILVLNPLNCNEYFFKFIPKDTPLYSLKAVILTFTVLSLA